MNEETPPYLDRRDMQVVSQLTEGKEYGALKIQRGYKRFTDISRDKTARERQIALFKSPCAEMPRPGVMKYLGLVDPSEGWE